MELGVMSCEDEDVKKILPEVKNENGDEKHLENRDRSGKEFFAQFSFS
jgi:hypothetical protein